MKHSKKVQNYLNKLNDARNAYKKESIENLTISVSLGNSKIGKVLNVSLAPVVDCPVCSMCENECYDIIDCRYTFTLLARARNSVIWELAPDQYFDQIEEAIKHHPSYEYFRFHVGGDIPNMNYLERMIELCKAHPKIRFWTYTKVYGLVNMYVKNHGDSKESAIPANLSIMFSEWRGYRMTNPYGFPEFKAIYSDEPEPAGIMECTGDCRICEESGIGCPYGQTVWTRIRHEVKK